MKTIVFFLSFNLFVFVSFLLACYTWFCVGSVNLSLRGKHTEVNLFHLIVNFKSHSDELNFNAEY